MPGRKGHLGEGGWSRSDVRGLPSSLTVNQRTGNTPTEYTATQEIEFTPGFESGSGDEFLAYLTNENSGGSLGVDGSGGVYRYGFNGKENDNEVKGEGAQQDYGMRIYDPRVGRFLSVDPITRHYPELTPYQFASNRPIDGIDLDGLEWSSGNDQKGRIRNSNEYEREFYPITALFRDVSAHFLNFLSPAGAIDDAVDTWTNPESTRSENINSGLELLTAPSFPGKPTSVGVKATPNFPIKPAPQKPVATKPTKNTPVQGASGSVTTAHNGNPNAAIANQATKPGPSLKTSGGSTINNSKWANQLNPKALNNGFLVPIKQNGYPDFSSYLYTKGPHVPGKAYSYNTVNIKMTGTYDADFAAADLAAGYSKKNPRPSGYTWHHTEKIGELQLIRSDAHDAARHSGGVQLYKEQNGGQGYR